MSILVFPNHFSQSNCEVLPARTPLHQAVKGLINISSLIQYIPCLLRQISTPSPSELASYTHAFG